MFKRIIKIVGLVVLGFVLVVGGVVGFMAVRGDFKKQVIKPTAVSFSITKTDLVFDVQKIGNQTVANEQIFSFTILAEPFNVTETECTLRLSNSALIDFVTWNKEKGEWEIYNSNKFHINQPIYFKLKNVTEQNENDYFDGSLSIIVKDASGLLKDTLYLNIDRIVTSISFKDNGKDENNTIVNGLFAYEGNSYGGTEQQSLEAVEGEDYPLEVITAPLKASKPFASRDAKITEIYYIRDNQPQLIVYNSDNDKVELHSYGNSGIVKQDCEFLKYDTINNRFVFNSNSSGKYEFKLATYPTYKIQEEMIADQTLSFVDRLNSGEMITKTTVISVTGTEAQRIEFAGDVSSIGMNLLKENKVVANDDTSVDMYNLGLTLLKSNSGTEISGRYNELKMLAEDCFTTSINWEMKIAKMKKASDEGDFEIDVDNGFVQYKDVNAIVSIYKEGNQFKARINNLDNNADGLEYDVTLNLINGKYTLALLNINSDTGIITGATFSFDVDAETSKTLTLAKDSTKYNLSSVEILQLNGDTSVYGNTYYANVQNCGGLILDGGTAESGYSFKALRSSGVGYDGGLYLTLLGKIKDTGVKRADTKWELINDKFVTKIDYNGAQSVISFMPIDAILENYDIKMYAIVVNTNGSFYYTINPKEIVVQTIDTQITLSNSGNVELPIVIGTGNAIGYSVGDDKSGYDVDGLVWQSQNDGGSYSEILLFAPQYSLLTTQPMEWGKGLKVYDGVGGSLIDTTNVDFVSNKYYTKNNYEFVDTISITIDGVGDAYLLGYVDGLQGFKNKVQPTGANYYSKLYPVVIKTTYLKDEARLQTAEEYINDILSKIVSSVDAKTNKTLNYNMSLAKGTYITCNGTATIEGQDGEFDYISVKNAISEYAPSKTDLPKNYEYYTLDPNTNKLSRILFNNSEEDIAEFLEGWDNYYLVVSHYVIDEVTFDGNITVEATPITAGKELNKITFIITSDDYNAQISGDNKINIDYAKVFEDEKYLVANSYYLLSEVDELLTSAFGGYFDKTNSNTYDNLNTDSEQDDIYTIIAGHKYIDMDWNANVVDTASEDMIGNKKATISLTLNHFKYNEILQYMLSRLEVRAYLYDLNDNPVGLVDTETISISALTWAENLLSEGDDAIAVISAEFEVNNTIANNHYVKFKWIYDDEYEIASQQLNIVSRDVKSYCINAYNADGTVYTGKINFKVSVGYDGGYTYGVTALDMNENILKDKDGNDLTKTPEMAFALTRHGGWIAPAPFYADNIDFTISEGTAKLVFGTSTDGVTTSNIIEFAQHADNVKTVIANRYNPDIELSIDTVVDTTGFEWKGGELKEVKSNASTATINELYYYGSDDITGELKLSIADYKITRADDVSNLYKVVPGNGTTTFDKIVSKSDETSTLVEISKVDQKWTITRTELCNIQLTITAVSVLDNHTIRIDFDSPWNIYHNYNNKTTTLYSRTTFILASALKDNSGNEISSDALYKFDIKTGDIYIDIHDAEGNKVDTVTQAGYEWKFTVPTVTKQTKYAFKLWYQEGAQEPKSVDTIYLNVCPNIRFANPIDVVVDLDDVNNNEYDLNSLNVKKYNTTKMYYKYSDSDLTEVDAGTTITYLVETFTDVDLNNVYSTNIASESNAMLRVDNPVSDSGTYYVRVTALNGDIVIGDIVFKVDAKSSVVDNTNIEIVAKEEKSFDLTVDNDVEDLNFALLRENGEYIPANRWIQIYTYEEDNTYLYDNDLKEYTALSKDDYDPQQHKVIYAHRGGYVDGITYKYNATDKKYELLTSNAGFEIQSSDYYYKYSLTDIFWIDHKDSNLVVTYNYANDKNLTHTIEGENKVNYLTYNGIKYQLIGTSYNPSLDDNDLVNDLTFDIKANKFMLNGTELQYENSVPELVTATANVGNAYYTEGGGIAIYCAQNAYLFKNVDNENEIIALSIETAGKTIYKFTIGENNVSLSYTTPLGKLSNLTLQYNDYVTDVTSIDCDIQFVFNNINIKTNDTYKINVKPYTLKRVEETDEFVYNKSYTLYDKTSGATTKSELFDLDSETNIEDIVAFDDSTDGSYNIVKTDNKYTITFNAKGNKYTTVVPITIKYSGTNQTYKYNVEFDVKNRTVVNINYPYSVDKLNSDEHTKFTTTIDQLSKGLVDEKGNGLYNVNDYLDYLGLTQEGRIPFDIALAGQNSAEKINLIEDTLHNIKRYSTITDGNASNIAIDKIVPVAVSASYADIWYTDVEPKISIIPSEGKISIAQELNYPGYVLFKIYAKNTGTPSQIQGEYIDGTGAYGYYLLRIVEDTGFSVISADGRKTYTKAINLDESGNVVGLSPSGNTIEGALEVADLKSISTYIDRDLANVYLFMVNSDNGKGERVVFGSDKQFTSGQFVPMETSLVYSQKIQTITLAVVVEYQDIYSGTSALVHICNIKLVVRPNITVSPEIDTNEEYYVTIENPEYYIYKANAITNNTGNDKYTDLSRYVSITDYTLKDATFVLDKGNSGYLSINTDTEDSVADGTLQYADTNKTYEIAIVTKQDASGNLGIYLKSKTISDEMWFYLKLTYENTRDSSKIFEIYLIITLSPYSYQTPTQVSVGGMNGNIANTTLSVKELLGIDYVGAYSYSISDGTYGVANSTDVDSNISFGAQILAQDTKQLSITLTSIYPNITRTVNIQLLPNISGKYDVSGAGSSNRDKENAADLTMSTLDGNGKITSIGSSLYVAFNLNGDGVVIKNKEGETDDVKDYLTISVAKMTSLTLTLTDWDNNPLEDKYFVLDDDSIASTITMNASGAINFVHSASDLYLRLTATINYHYTETYYKLVKDSTTFNDSITYYDVDGNIIKIDQNYTGDKYRAEEDADPAENGTYYSKDADGKLTVITNGSYSTTYPLFIMLPKTYELSSVYRVVDATYEVVEDSQVLNLQEDRRDIEEYFLGETIGGGNVNQSRLAIQFINEPTSKLYGYDNLKALGLLQESNPNKLKFFNGSNELGSSIVFSSNLPNVNLTFTNATYDNPNTQTIETISAYKFNVYAKGTNYGDFNLNTELQKIEDGGITTILLTSEQLSTGVVLGHLNYIQSEANGNIAYVIVDGSVAHEFVIDQATNTSKIKLKGTIAETTTFNVSIITVNGQITSYCISVADINISYAYGENGYENAYAGGDIGKLNEEIRDRDITYADGNQLKRVTINLDQSDIAYSVPDSITNRGYELDYVGSVNGHYDVWNSDSYDYLPTNKSLIYIENEVIKSREIGPSDVKVTMIFNVYDDGDIIGRVYYKLNLKNNILIELNPLYSSGEMVDLYLGSTACVDSGDNTEIDITQKEINGGDNSLYITLYKLSYVKDETTGKYGSIKRSNMSIDSGDISQYLDVSIDNINGDDMYDGATSRVKFENGILKVAGNPSGTFNLNISASNGLGYEKSISVNLHKYDNTITSFANSVNAGSGNGFASGTNVELFVDVGNSSNDYSKYAFKTQRQGYKANTTNNVVERTTEKSNFVNNTDISFDLRHLIFDDGTSISDMKSSDKWSTGTQYYISMSSAIDVTNTFPEVTLTYGGDKQYQIVAYRLTVTHNGQSNYYYAFYKVYNPQSIQINSAYDNKTVIYADTADDRKAWITGSNITFMGSRGMYNLPFKNVGKLEQSVWESGTYYYEASGSYTISNAHNADIEYYQIDSDVYNDISSYSLYVIGGDISTETVCTLVPVSNIGLLQATLPDGLFTNSAEITFILKKGNHIVMEDVWTLTTNLTIKPNKEMRLDNFFLQSEISNSQYHDATIIGIGTNYNNFVQDGSSATATSKGDVLTIDSYILRTMEYTRQDPTSSVFTISKTYNVLVGNSYAMYLKLTAGYINITIDEDDIDTSNSSKTKEIPLGSFVAIYSADTFESAEAKPDTSASLTYAVAGNNYISCNNGKVTLSGLTTNTSNQYCNVTITYTNGGTTITRTVELYFNIIINAKEFVDDKLTYNSALADAMANDSDDELTADEINNNLALKKELLGLIKFNDQPVNGEDTAVIGRYSIGVAIDEDDYVITYTYQYGSTTATRTFKMAVPTT